MSGTARALKLKCPKCKALPGAPCTALLEPKQSWRPAIRAAIGRPHNERFQKLHRAEKLLVAKHLRITVPELDRRTAEVLRATSRRLQAYQALRDFELAERDQLRTWLGQFGSVLWDAPSAAVSDDATRDVHPPLSGA